MGGRLVIDATFLEKMAGRTHRSQVVVCHLCHIPSHLNISDGIPFQYEDIVACQIGYSPLWQTGHPDLIGHRIQTLNLIEYSGKNSHS